MAREIENVGEIQKRRIAMGKKNALLISEKPVTEDSLQLSTYIEGISEFISECPTPMTISIQGDWGAGKTTIFNLVSNHLNNRGLSKDEQKDWNWEIIKDFNDAQYPVIPINTWQFAVAGYKDNLTVVLISLIYNQIKAAIKATNPTEEKLKGAKKVFEGEADGFNNCLAMCFKTTLVVAAHLLGGDSAGSLVGNAMKKNEIPDVTYVQKMRDMMQKGINALCSIMKKDRIIIFIDDLDRLEPRNALDLLEGMKNFIDCENCVFVLAIDQKVVFQGVKEKYGDEMGTTLGSKFFDKIIQVPFTLPMVSYDVKEYIKKLRPTEADNKGLIEKYDLIVCALTDKNPRGLKRLFSMFLLYEKFENLKENDYREKEILLAILAFQLQLKDEDIFSSLLAEVSGIDKDDISNWDVDNVKSELEKPAYQDLANVLQSLYGTPAGEEEEECLIVPNDIYKIMIRLLKGTIGATAGVEDDIPVGVRGHFRKFESLLLSNENVIREIEKNGNNRYYRYYKESKENGNYVMISVRDKHININLYGEGIPGVRQKIVSSEEFEAVEDPNDVKDGEKLRYMKHKEGDESDYICIVRVDNRVAFEKLKNLYEKYIK